ncbi:MAG TPA: hypothetical protein VN633_10475 [Bryobacteraceae bacterium]|nr:hypothetical protein [Bryobacteraceae bacterium]
MNRKAKRLNLRAGEVVEVRGRDEILATLDSKAALDGLPFMPEMLQHCGKRFRVYKRADKTCDNIKAWSMRRMVDSVFLQDLRCDGVDHGGCQADCLIFWKEAWLKRVGDKSPSLAPPPSPGAGCILDTLLQSTKADSPDASCTPTYSCQATRLLEFTSNLPWWDVRQHVRDITSGNVKPECGGPSQSDRILETVLSAITVLRGLVISTFNAIQSRRHTSRYPSIEGTTAKAPPGNLNLRPGELVKIKSKEEIVATLNDSNRNRGLLFEGEMLRYCNGIYKVRRRVNRIIDEKTGKMLDMKNPCILLEDVFCQGDYHNHCPRAIYSYWREGWLERASGEITAGCNVPQESARAQAGGFVNNGIPAPAEAAVDARVSASETMIGLQ